ncbi:MAG: hypothetical protein DPW09_22625 [Anaerolineae bacterium]|nr:hypothetical protein [Anaerolineales bacterium]MCQ3976233.1 hypothetical protein [Anaerolineae bacterium]
MTILVLIAFLVGILIGFLMMLEHLAHLVNVVTHVDIQGCFVLFVLFVLVVGCIIGTQLAS